MSRAMYFVLAFFRVAFLIITFEIEAGFCAEPAIVTYSEIAAVPTLWLLNTEKAE